MKKINKGGRPPFAAEDRKTYKRLAIRPSTYEKIKEQSTKHEMQIQDYIEMVVNKEWETK